MQQKMERFARQLLAIMMVLLIQSRPEVFANEMIALPVDMEVELALSALPEHLRAETSIPRVEL